MTRTKSKVGLLFKPILKYNLYRYIRYKNEEGSVQPLSYCKVVHCLSNILYVDSLTGFLLKAALGVKEEGRFSCFTAKVTVSLFRVK